MAVDKFGRVIVNPNIPMEMTDFARLYATEGSTPSDAAGNIHMNYPPEAKGRIAQAWNQFGIRQSPEQYFSDPANIAATLESTKQAPITRNATGGVNVIPGAAAEPADWRTRSNYSSFGSPQGQQEAAQLSAASQANFPLSAATTPDEVARAQQQGDIYGDTRRILASLNGVDLKAQVGLPETVRRGIGEYNPKGGLGAKPSMEAMQSNLDFGIVNDPEFQKIQSMDPLRASFVYKSLTGRDYKADSDQHQSVQKERAKIGVGFARKQLEQGAKFDPMTGKWKVWQIDEPEETGGTSFGAAPRASKQLVEATPEQSHWLNTYYSGVMGHGLPKQDLTMRKQANVAEQNVAALQDKPELQSKVNSAIQLYKQETGRDVSPAEKIAIIAKAQQQGATTTWKDKSLTAMDALGRAVMGHKQNAVPVGSSQTKPEDLNYWGRFLEEFAREDDPADSEIAAAKQAAMQPYVPY